MGKRLVTAALLVAGCLDAAVDSRFASVGDARLQYADWGGSGDALIFVPGGCDTAFVFGDLAERLARGFRVLGLTPRGCGASDRPASGYEMARQIDDILGFLDRLQIPRATLIGHSSGGGKITQFARAYPARVDRLVYLDTVYRYVAPGLEEKIDAEIGKAVGGKPMDSADLWKRRARLWEVGAWSPALDRNFDETFVIDPDGRVRPRREPAAGWRRDVDRDMQAGLYTDTRIVRPALMIFAMDTDRDRANQFGPDARRELQPLIAATDRERRREIDRFRSNGLVRIVELRHTAHYCFAQRPDTIYRLIVAFLSKRR